MPWPEQRIASWDQFQRLVVDPLLNIGDVLQRGYVFRGQCDASWSLKPSLMRALERNGHSVTSGLRVERLAVKRFSEQAHLQLESHLFTGMNEVDWWTLMQHHGAPSRTLDWSHSPFVGLYFAVCDGPELDGAVWLFQRGLLMKRVEQRYGSVNANVAEQFDRCFRNAEAPIGHVLGFDRIKATPRMVAQQGTFTAAANILADHAVAIEDVFAEAEREQRLNGRQDVFRFKYIIASTVKNEFVRRLQLVNVRADSLFPGIDGLGRGLRELVRLSLPEQG
jgi:hypothetical protein